MKRYLTLLKSAMDGDKQAFGELTKVFEGFAFIEAAKLLDRRDLVEDAVQEAFITAYIRLSDLNNPAAFPSWLKKIIRTCCRKLRNRNSARFTAPDTLYALPDPRPTPFEAMLQQEDRAEVRSTLKHLKEDMREAFLQRYVHGRTYNEIAHMLGLPMGTVKRRLHASRIEFIEHFRARNQALIRVGYLPISDHLLAMVSHHRHDHHNYSILLRKFLSWSRLVTSLRRGQLDAAFIMAPLALSLRAGGMPIFYVLDAHQNGSAITVRSNSSYKKEDIGGRVGLPHAISTHSMILHHMLDGQTGGVANTLKPKYINPSYLNRSLMTRNIDAFFCAEPWNTLATLEGTGRILAQSSDIYPGHICCILVVRESFAVEHGDILSQYLKLLLSAGEMIATKPELCAEIHSKYTGVAVDVVKTILDNKTVTYHDLVPDQGALESVMKLSLKAGILEKPCDLNSFLRTDFI